MKMTWYCAIKSQRGAMKKSMVPKKLEKLKIDIKCNRIETRGDTNGI